MKNFATICQNSNLILLVLRVMILNFKQCSAKELVQNILMEAQTFASLKLIMKFKHMTLIKMCHINFNKEKDVESLLVSNISMIKWKEEKGVRV